MKSRETPQSQAVIINKVQLLLAEKRTSLSTMRTALAVLALPLAMVTLLIATSRYYDILGIMYLLLPVLAVCAGLLILGLHLAVRSLVHLHHYDRMIGDIKRKNGWLSDVMD
ncbi:MAG: hypothetical protein KKA60_00430 [Proteobacteria bacterium]|nr:hypothetical protein [Pseudomonadota bacterium]